MKILLLHTDYIKFKPLKKALKTIGELSEKEKEGREIKEALVVLTAVEKSDSDVKKVVAEFIKNVEDVAKQVNVKNVVIYPYAHLSSDLASPELAVKVLEESEKSLKKNFNVSRAPFGYYKEFELKVKGHPLSELSREISNGTSHSSSEASSNEREIKFADVKAEEKVKETPKKRKEGSEFSKFVLVDLNGNEYVITSENYTKSEIWKNKEESYKRLKQLVTNEFGLNKSSSGKVPMHIKYMRNHELVDYCDVSEAGNYKWYPNGVLIRRLLLDYANKLARKWGALEMVNPLIIKGDNNVVGQLMGEFHERDYKVDGGRGIGFLRYASDPLGFPFMQNVKFTYKQAPLKVYEEASCFRNEQEGEVSGLKRVRNFLMTDMHAACADDEQAKKEFELLCFKFGELMNDIIAQGRWVLAWEGTEEFYDNNKKWLTDISRKMNVPAFFKLSKDMSHYYAIKNEYQTILEDNSNIQVSTVQWDVKDGPRFDIGYTGEDGKKHPCKVILHASSFGSIERTLCSILENIAINEKEGKVPGFAYWLSPVQIRLLPVSERFNEQSENLASELRDKGIRADVDDRNETSNKKIVDSEKEWIPFTVFIGEKELKDGVFKLRVRGEKGLKELTKENLIIYLQDLQGNMPWRNLATPILISKKPTFFG